MTLRIGRYLLAPIWIVLGISYLLEGDLRGILAVLAGIAFGIGAFLKYHYKKDKKEAKNG